MAASTPLFASFDASDARRVNFSDVAPRTLSPPPPATASAPNLDLQQLEEAWTLRMEQPAEQLELLLGLSTAGQLLLLLSEHGRRRRRGGGALSGS